MHEQVQESLLLGRGTKRNFAWYFHSFLQVFERGLSAENLLFLREEMADYSRLNY